MRFYIKIHFKSIYHLAPPRPSNGQGKLMLHEDGTVISSTFDKGSASPMLLTQCCSPIAPSQTHPYTILQPVSHLITSNIRSNWGSHTLESFSEIPPSPTPQTGQKLLNPLPLPCAVPQYTRNLPFNLPDPTGPKPPHPTSYFHATWTQGPADQKTKTKMSTRCAAPAHGGWGREREGSLPSTPTSLRDAARTVTTARPRVVSDYLPSTMPLFRLRTTFPLRLCWSTLCLCPVRTWLPLSIIMALSR